MTKNAWITANEIDALRFVGDLGYCTRWLGLDVIKYRILGMNGSRLGTISKTPAGWLIEIP